jgi:PhnB protein
VRNNAAVSYSTPQHALKERFEMAKPAKKGKAKQKAARTMSKPKALAKSAKPSARKKAAMPSRTAARQKTAKIDPLNRNQYQAITPMLVVSDIRKMVDFYTRAFGFTVRGVMESPDGPVHAELRLRETTLMLSPESQEQKNLSARSIGGTPTTLYVTVENVDAIFGKALAAGGQVLMPLMDMFWGDRCAMIGDPDGNKWMIATHVAEPSEKEMMEAMRQQMEAQQSGQAAAAAAGSESEY